nr:MAG: putative capsid protein [Circoviridae sp.]
MPYKKRTGARRRTARRTRSRSRGTRSRSRGTRSRSRGTRSSNRGLQIARLAAGIGAFGKPACKQIIALDREAEAVNTRTLSAVNLCQIQRSAGNTNNERAGTEVHITGFLCKCGFRNITDRVVILYEYWLVPVAYFPGFDDISTNMFTKHGMVDDMDNNWVATAPSMMFDEPINPNAFKVLKKRKTLLSPGTSFTNTFPQDKGKSSAYYTNFIRLDRKFTYGSIEDGEDERETLQAPVYYVTWCNFEMEPTGSNPANALARELHLITYFRDGESGL